MIKVEFKNMVELLFTGKSNISDKAGNIHNMIYSEIDDNFKEELFFIVNRFLAKKYPQQAQHFNSKLQDKATAMDIWNMFLKKSSQVPFWFWKGKKTINKPKIKDWELLYDVLQDEFTMDDISLICELYPNEVKDEIKHIKLIKKERNK